MPNLSEPDRTPHLCWLPAPPCSPVPAIVRAQSKTIVTTSYGGTYEDNYRKLVTEPFSRKTGANFVFKRGGSDEWLNNAHDQPR